MADTVEQVLEGALRLSPDRQAWLVAELPATLEPDTASQRRSEAEWIEEIARRAGQRWQAVQGCPGLRPEPRFKGVCPVGERGPPFTEAVDGLPEVAAWYGERRSGLELEFLAEIDKGRQQPEK